MILVAFNQSGYSNERRKFHKHLDMEYNSIALGSMGKSVIGYSYSKKLYDLLKVASIRCFLNDENFAN